MPLGRNLSKNVKTLISEGFSQDQAVAIAHKEAQKQRRKNRGSEKRRKRR